MPNRNSRLFRELTRGELAAAVRRHFGAVDFTARLMDGGLFNTTYLLSLSDGRRYVLRSGPVNRQLLLPFELRLFQSETAVYKLCHERGIPVPNVVELVLPDDRADSSIDCRGYMITEYIDSLPMTSELISPDEKSVLRRELGEITARFNSMRGRASVASATCSEHLTQVAAPASRVGATGSSPSSPLPAARYDHTRSFPRLNSTVF